MAMNAIDPRVGPRDLLLDSDDLLAAPRAAQALEQKNLTYSDFLRYLVADLARGLERNDWAQEIAHQGDIFLARRLAASCKNPDLDRSIHEYFQAWKKRAQEALEGVEKKIHQVPFPLVVEDEQRLGELRAETQRHIREARFHLASITINTLYQTIEEAQNHAVQLQKERRDQALALVDDTRKRYRESLLSREANETNEVIYDLLSHADRLASQGNPALDTVKRYCSAIDQFCQNPTNAQSRALLEELTATITPVPRVSRSDQSGTDQGIVKPSEDVPASEPASPEPVSQHHAPPGGWTADRDWFLITNYHSLTDGELAMRFAVRPEAIGQRIEELDLVGLRPSATGEPQTVQEPWPNPYIAGKPILTRKMFYGRKRDIDHIHANLDHGEYEEQSRIVILEGHRRTGKTSLLRYLEGKKHEPSILAPRIPVYLNIEDCIPFTSSSLFYKLSKAIYKALQQRFPSIPEPREADYKDFGRAWHDFLDHVEEAAEAVGLVLMFDEFQIIESRRDSIDTDIYWVLRSDIQHRSHIDFILAGTMLLGEIVRRREAALFGIGPTYTLHSLDEKDARELICKPAGNQDIIFDSDAVEQILALTACSPYCIQLLCSVLFNHLNACKKRRVTTLDLERLLPVALQQGNTQFELVFSETDVTSVERYLLAGAAELIETQNGYCQRDQLMSLLLGKKLVSDQVDFDDALTRLTLGNLLKIGSGGESVAFEIDLFRQWMRDQKKLDKMVRQERERKEREQRRG